MRGWKVGTTTTTTATAPATTTQQEVATMKKSLRDVGVDFPETANFQKVQMAPLCRHAPDIVRVISSCRLDPKIVREVDEPGLDASRWGS